MQDHMKFEWRQGDWTGLSDLILNNDKALCKDVVEQWKAKATKPVNIRNNKRGRKKAANSVRRYSVRSDSSTNSLKISKTPVKQQLSLMPIAESLGGESPSRIADEKKENHTFS